MAAWTVDEDSVVAFFSDAPTSAEGPGAFI
jgi:hypothetical protein